MQKKISTNPISFGDLRVINLTTEDIEVTHEGKTQEALAASADAEPEDVPAPDPTRNNAYIVSGKTFRSMGEPPRGDTFCREVHKGPNSFLQLALLTAHFAS